MLRNVKLIKSNVGSFVKLKSVHSYLLENGKDILFSFKCFTWTIQDDLLKVVYFCGRTLPNFLHPQSKPAPFCGDHETMCRYGEIIWYRLKPMLCRQQLMLVLDHTLRYTAKEVVARVDVLVGISGNFLFWVRFWVESFEIRMGNNGVFGCSWLLAEHLLKAIFRLNDGVGHGFTRIREVNGAS